MVWWGEMVLEGNESQSNLNEALCIMKYEFELILNNCAISLATTTGWMF